jgi:hypothetical protein
MIQEQFPSIAFSWLSVSTGDDDVFILSQDSWSGKPFTFNPSAFSGPQQPEQ